MKTRDGQKPLTWASIHRIYRSRSLILPKYSWVNTIHVMSPNCIVKFLRRFRKDSSVPVPNPEEIDLDDTVIVPNTGFLQNDSNIVLPTYYQPTTKNYQWGFSPPAQYKSLTIDDVVTAIRKECYLARCIIFEAARLQRRLLSTNRLKLSGSSRILDMALRALSEVADTGHRLIDEHAHDSILQGKPFRTALGMSHPLSRPRSS